MPAKRYSERNKKPYGRGHGYGGFANYSFSKEEYEDLMDGKIVQIAGVKKKAEPDKRYVVDLKYEGRMDRAGRKQYTATNWVEMVKESVHDTESTVSVEENQADNSRAEQVADVFEHLEAGAKRYNNLSAEEAEQMSDEELLDLAYQASEARDLELV